MMALATRPIGKSLALACLLATVVGLSACMDDAEKISGFMERGNAYKDAEQYEEAIIEYRNVLQLDPNFSDAHGKLAEVY
ncbi:MAG: tetratricopeptide repeat protein, partial [Deltaproteobacteria bacterium]|nr:tetratricopeptide repeat protein [Deltaproteobacteria bacterium]